MSGTLPPAPILHDLRVTLASDARIDTLLAQAAVLIETGAEAGLRVDAVLNAIGGLRAEFEQQQQMLRHIIHMENNQMVKLADLQDAVTRLEENSAAHAQVTSQAVDLIRSQHTDIGEIKSALVALQDNGTDDDLAAVIARIDQSQAASAEQFSNLSAAIAEVIPNAPAPEPLPAPEPVPEPVPEPTPAPVEPAPEPTPDVPVEPTPEPLPDTPAEPVPAPDPNAGNG